MVLLSSILPNNFWQKVLEPECPECGCRGAHFCVGKRQSHEDFEAYFERKLEDARDIQQEMEAGLDDNHD